MFLQIFFFGCLGIYVISMIEIIGTYFLTKSVKGYCSDADLIFCMLIPPIAPFFAIASLIVKVFYSMHDMKTPVLCSVVSLAVNVGLNLILMT